MRIAHTIHQGARVAISELMRSQSQNAFSGTLQRVSSYGNVRRPGTSAAPVTSPRADEAQTHGWARTRLGLNLVGVKRLSEMFESGAAFGM